MPDPFHSLVEAGLIPRESGPRESGDGDWLPVVVDAWEQVGNRDRADHFRQSMALGARLTVIESPDCWLGPRLAWWPRGEPAQRRVALISSRLGRELDRHRSWFTVLRAACLNLDPRAELLLAVQTTATGTMVDRAGRLFGVPILRVDCTSDDVALEVWGQRLLQPDDGDPVCGWSVRLSPPLAPGHWTTPVADRAALALSDRVIAVRIRAGGHQFGLIGDRLNDDRFPPASVYLAIGPDLVPRSVAEPMMDRGAIGWVVLDTLPPQDAHAAPWVAAGNAATTAPIVPLPSSQDWKYLTHCTRRRWGPWPDESQDMYWDDLILDRTGADHSALAALWRIVHTGRLMATSELTRGNCSVVCFTEVPLAGLPRLRRFRSHLSRWDFEPYGICIHRAWLEQYGAQPVIYGDDGTWESLDAGQRPFFQRSHSATAKGKPLDWTIEQEWRVIGDVLLDSLPVDAAVLFVPTVEEARQLAAVSRWPVTVLDTTPKPPEV